MTKTERKAIEQAKAEQRVAIARDVIEHLNLMQVMRHNTYLKGFVPNLPKTGEAQKHINKIQKHCQVCALGACFLSYVRLNDDTDIKEFCYPDLTDHNNNVCVEYSDIAEKLKGIFSREQLELIE